MTAVTPNDPLLTLRQLCCIRDDRVLFSELALDLAPGEIVQVTGPNGSGKTTLLRIVSGLSLDFEGEITWSGIGVERNRLAYQQDLLFIGHQVGIKAALTPEENLRAVMGMYGQYKNGDILDALGKVDLYGFEDVPCYQLSAGQQRRVALARLHLSRQCLWILDEPFTAIDRAGVKALESLLISHAQQGGIVMLTTHHELGIQYQGLKRLDLAELLSVSDHSLSVEAV